MNIRPWRATYPLPDECPACRHLFIPNADCPCTDCECNHEQEASPFGYDPEDFNALPEDWSDEGWTGDLCSSCHRPGPWTNSGRAR